MQGIEIFIVCTTIVFSHNYFWRVSSVPWAADMDTGEDQNTGTTNGNPQTSGNSRAPQIAHMSLYERQAVQVCTVVKSINVSALFQYHMFKIIQYHWLQLKAKKPKTDLPSEFSSRLHRFLTFLQMCVQWCFCASIWCRLLI